MADEPISELTLIAAPTGTPPYPTAFTNPSTGAMLEILDTTNTIMAASGTNSRIPPGHLLMGFLAAGSNVTLTETSGIVTIAGASGLPDTGSNGQVLTVASGAPAWAAPVTNTTEIANLISGDFAITATYPTFQTVTGMTIALPAGTYILWVSFVPAFQFTTTAGNYAELFVQLYDTTNSFLIPASQFCALFGNAQATITNLIFKSYVTAGPFIYSPSITPATIAFQVNITSPGSVSNAVIGGSAPTGYSSLNAVRIA